LPFEVCRLEFNWNKKLDCTPAHSARVDAHEGDGTGVGGEETKATLALGKMFI
jgi:hypothetical protein